MNEPCPCRACKAACWTQPPYPATPTPTSPSPGTGKTETVKELARCLGKQCVVFNTTEQLEPGHMTRLLMGIISTGAWACFDEFNRMDMEVRSGLPGPPCIHARLLTYHAGQAPRLHITHRCCSFWWVSSPFG